MDESMKLIFPHKEHKNFELMGESFTIGSSEESSIRIEAVGMSPNHARLAKDGDVYSLIVKNPASIVTVNGRLVKGSKEVREGDLMIIAQVHCKLEGDKVEEKDDNRTRIRMALPKYILRGVSGVYFGKTFPLRGKTSLGRHSENDIFVNVDGISRKHAEITVLADSLQVEDLDSSNGTFVNGEQISKQEVKIGDEIKLDNIRFLIQSPGMPMSKDASSTTSTTSESKPKPVKSSSNAAGNSGSSLKWIVTALVLIVAAAGGAWYMGMLDKFL
jgi:pSer/pThr/pTyr-binding forkhead associated (FHA) protein